MVENKSRGVAYQDLINIPMSSFRMEASEKAKKELIEIRSEKYLPLSLQMEPKFSAWSLDEDIELQHFCT